MKELFDRRVNSRPLALVVGALCLAWFTGAGAQAFPSKPITISVPFPPGGATDVATRMIGQKVSENIGQPVVVENRPGAGGVIAAGVVRKATPDGYTLMLGTTGTMAVSQTLNPHLPYDPEKDFLPITLLVSTSNVLVVPAGSPIKSVADLVAAAKAKPGGLTFASQGLGSGGHLLGEMLKAQAHIPLVHVLYKGSAPALADVLAGRIDIFFDALITSVPLIKQGRLVPLAVTSKVRSPHLPDVPTMAEAGYPGVIGESWFGLFAPAGTPASTIDRLHDAFVKAAHDPGVSRLLTERALDVVTDTPAELAARIRDDAARLGKVVKASGARVN